MGKFEPYNVDQFVYDLLNEERVCDVQLPRLQKRSVLEDLGEVGRCYEITAALMLCVTLLLIKPKENVVTLSLV